MGYGDLWGFTLTVLIFYKSRLGFMGIYITLGLSINPHKSFPYYPMYTHKSFPSTVSMHLPKGFMGIYGDLWGFISPKVDP